MQDLGDLFPDLLGVRKFDLACLDTSDRGIDPVPLPGKGGESALD